MNEPTLTSLVYNLPNSKQLGLVPFYYRYRSCKSNFPNRTYTDLTGFTPEEQYQKQLIIQKKVRLNSSLYTSILQSIKSHNGSYGVCWNQMSDRYVPSVQKSLVPTGTYSALNKRRSSVTSSRPGCQAPGGIGCDIKHNSYDRYLNRLKGNVNKRCCHVYI